MSVQRDSERNRELMRSAPHLILAHHLPSKLIPLPMLNRQISFLKEIGSPEYQTREVTDMPTFSGSFG